MHLHTQVVTTFINLPMKKKRLEVTKSRETKERTPLAVEFFEDAPMLI